MGAPGNARRRLRVGGGREHEGANEVYFRFELSCGPYLALLVTLTALTASVVALLRRHAQSRDLSCKVTVAKQERGPAATAHALFVA